MSKTKLPKNFIDKYFEEAKGSRIFGILLSELSKDELMAVAAAGWKAEQTLREDNLNSSREMRLRKWGV